MKTYCISTAVKEGSSILDSVKDARKALGVANIAYREPALGMYATFCPPFHAGESVARLIASSLSFCAHFDGKSLGVPVMLSANNTLKLFEGEEDSLVLPLKAGKELVVAVVRFTDEVSPHVAWKKEVAPYLSNLHLTVAKGKDLAQKIFDAGGLENVFKKITFGHPVVCAPPVMKVKEGGVWKDM